jgi:diguanylate cyclase (GGDEF)-like protein
MPDTAVPTSWRRAWRAAPLLLLLVGLTLSVFAARARRSTLQGQERESFHATAADVTATVAVGLRSDTDFIRMLRALAAMQPRLSSTQLARWYAQLDGSKGQVGSLATAVVSVVPAGQLRRFQARRLADPAFHKLAPVGARIEPPGRRARYCLLSAAVSRLPESPLIELAAQADWCSPQGLIKGTSRVLAAESEDAQLTVSPPMLGTSFVGAAVYRRSVPLRTAAQRRRATIGWIWGSLDIPAVLRAALAAHPGFSIALYHRDPLKGMQLIGAAGTPPSSGALSYSSRLDVSGPWAVRVVGKPTLRGLSAEGQQLFVGAVGALITVLLVVLASIVLRSRERALGLADERGGQLRYQALHDALTGLPNRMLALDRAEHMLAQARRRGASLSALCVDLDAFDYVNDAYGQVAGDAVLKLAAARLEGVVGETDTVARIGADEFVVLLEDCSLESGPELTAQRLLEVLRLPYEVGDGAGDEHQTISLTASIGIAHGVHDSAEELLRRAGVALAEAKAWGHNRYIVFESTMRTAKDRLALKAELAGALERGELSLRYQPIFELGSQRLAGVEALLRWHRPDGTVVPPGEFVPIAEESGLIAPIGRWVLVEACRQAAAWQGEGHRLGVSVNVSARQLESESLLADVQEALAAAALDPAVLTLEVTETVIMRDAEVNTKRLQQLKRLGVRVAVDDFGTGHSSLAYLREFPVDVLKIDRSFIVGIAESKESASIVHILMQLGKTLGLKTLAEGIEDEAQLRILLREGCDYGQGFLFRRPLAAEALADLLDRDAPQREPALELGLDR